MFKINLPLMENNIPQEDLDQVIAFLKTSPILTNSRKVLEFEEAWSKWLGVKYSVFVNSGSSANFISMSLIREKFGPGEIIVPALTWVSDIVSVIFCGHQPIFVDIDLKTLSMNEEQVISKIGPQTKGVFLTHALGLNGLSERLLKILAEKKIPLIEDVCESHGASFQHKKLGSFGLISNFSFYYAHHLSTIEGGMVCTNDDELYQMARMLRSHGLLRESTDSALKTKLITERPELNPEFIFCLPGFNFRNTEIGGVLGLSQLKRLDENNEKRRENFRYFLQCLDSKKFFTDFSLHGQCNYALVLILRDPDTNLWQKVTDFLNHQGIEFRRGTVGGGNQLRQPYLQKWVGPQEHLKFPITEHVHFYGAYLGNYPGLEKSKIAEICAGLNQL